LLQQEKMSRALLSSFVLVVQLLIFVFSKRQTNVIVKLPENCKVHSDCQPYQALCVKNGCKPAAPVIGKNGDGIYCDENDDQCADGQACLYGLCFEEYSKILNFDLMILVLNLLLFSEEEKASTSSRPPKSESQCRKHDDCNVREVCVKKKCEKAKPTGKECERHRDCGNNEQACWHEICWELFGEIANAPPSSSSSSSSSSLGQCKKHNDCYGNKVCISGKCVDAEPMSKCRKDEDCARNSICKDGVCFKLTKANYCSNHEQCSGRKLCDENSTCQDAALQSPLKLCDQDKDCTEKGVCKTGYCWIFKKDSEGDGDENDDDNDGKEENENGNDADEKEEEDNDEKDEEETKGDDDEEKKENENEEDEEKEENQEEEDEEKS
ncbi:Tenascin-X, partial [Trichinella sp. T6]